MGIKVVCIKECKGIHYSAIFGVGDILTALEVPKDYHYIMKSKPEECCIIEEESKNGLIAIWHKSNFAPISDIDETEMERNYKKELV